MKRISALAEDTKQIETQDRDKDREKEKQTFRPIVKDRVCDIKRRVITVEEKLFGFTTNEYQAQIYLQEGERIGNEN